MNRIQQLQFELIRLSSFNGFDGDQVADDLEKHRDLWKGVVMDRLNSLIKLRDIADDCWNVDTLFILPREGHENDLEALAREWHADEIDWLGGGEACSLLGSYSRDREKNQKAILRVWWD